MRKIIIEKDAFCELATKFSFQAMAKMHKCDARTIAKLAHKYGVKPTFGNKPEQEGEAEEILRLFESGKSAKSISKIVGRSQDFVTRRIFSPNYGNIKEDHKIQRRYFRSSWPRPIVVDNDALAGRHFDDVEAPALHREWPPSRPPVNGVAWAARVRNTLASFTLSSAAMCEGA